jgi:hypothetical protein
LSQISLDKGNKKYIHVNQFNIKHNAKHGDNLPVITTKVGSKSGAVNYYGGCVEICDEEGNVVARLVYEPEDKLKCGAVVFIETENPVNIVEPETWKEIQARKKKV